MFNTPPPQPSILNTPPPKKNPGKTIFKSFWVNEYFPVFKKQ